MIGLASRVYCLGINGHCGVIIGEFGMVSSIRFMPYGYRIVIVGMPFL